MRPDRLFKPNFPDDEISCDDVQAGSLHHSVPIRGRGVVGNPTNRFERIDCVADVDPEELGEYAGELVDPRRLGTEFFVDLSRSIIATNNSPDVGFDASINPYRGCEHGCAYCYARPTHEYLGWSAGLDFEAKILVKRDAAVLLRRELASAKWVPRVLGLSGVTDPYQPVERRLRITRGVLEVLAECRNPVGIVTKNHLVTRDVDLLAQLAAHNAVRVCISICSLDAGLTRVLEPRTSHPQRRLAAIRILADAGVPVGVFTAPVIPGLTDRDIPNVLEAAAEAGAKFAGMTMLRLPYAVAPLFEAWLAAHVPDRKDRVLARIRDMRGGKLNVSTFGERMKGKGVYAEQVYSLFKVHARRLGLNRRLPEQSTASFRRPQIEEPTPNDGQLRLF